MKAVFHLSTVASDQVFQVLQNIENMIEEEPEAKVALQMNSNAVTALKEGSAFSDRIEELIDDVEFKACANSIESTAMERDQVIEGVEIVPSAVVELARLQSEEGYAYIRP
jgi:intracellular sulfur oxidation DsrE/DsrF family protein